MNKEFKLEELPISENIETVKILKKVNLANRALAELKGVSKTVPNSSIFINSLVLQEAKDSSEIENIITTQDELFKSDIDIAGINKATKEVKRYSSALKKGFELITQNKILTTRYIIEIQQILENNDAGIRTQAGTALKNVATGKIIYTPPQDFATISKLMKNLEDYINTEDATDPLIKMAIIHYQFESIHPFYDGNGRTGRIINILYLVLNELLDIPILYLSRYIIRTKNDYYRLLQEVRTKNSWEEWILYLLEGIEQTSLETIRLINEINDEMLKAKIKIRTELPKIYNKDLVEILFVHPYTKIEFLVEKLGITRQTASKYLKQLEGIGILKKEKLKNNNYYVNIALFELFSKQV
jgi:Fic family protein